jgi:dTDP-4-amino-4,6-dideoxygalactose transaminase
MLPASRRDGTHVYCLYTIRHPRREGLRSHLLARGIATEIYYPLPLHLQEAYRGLGYGEGDLPVSERLSREVLSIPIYPELTAEQVGRVADAVLEFAGSEAESGAEEAVGRGS